MGVGIIRLCVLNVPTWARVSQCYMAAKPKPVPVCPEMSVMHAKVPLLQSLSSFQSLTSTKAVLSIVVVGNAWQGIGGGTEGRCGMGRNAYSRWWHAST